MAKTAQWTQGGASSSAGLPSQPVAERQSVPSDPPPSYREAEARNAADYMFGP